MMGDGRCPFINRVGAEMSEERRAVSAGAAVLAGHDLHRHVAGAIVDDDPDRLTTAIGAERAIDLGPGIAPGAEEFLRDRAVRLRAHHATDTYWVSRNSISP